MKSDAKTVDEYISSLPADKREVVANLRQKILENLPAGYEESLEWGMITYQVPLSAYPDTYNKKPLMLAALASQKNYFALYLMPIYMHPPNEEWLRTEFVKEGKKLDMGKSCMRFKKLENLSLAPILKIIHDTDMPGYIKYAKEVRAAK